MEDPLGPVAAIMRRHGVQCSPAEFHAAVNVEFHRFESEVYDQLHRDMWESLPAQISLLAQDCLAAGVSAPLRVLDVGCGTGLATELLLRSPLAPYIQSVDLLDTSDAMLARAQARREKWRKPGQALLGLLDSLRGGSGYDLIITCSVLHHVPDLHAFIRTAAELQTGRPGAFLLHLQDPNGDYAEDPDLQRRRASASGPRMPEWLARLAPRRVFGRLLREIKGEQGRDYISRMNRELVKSGLLARPLSVAEIFAITDIHIRDGGISIDRIASWLPEYDLAGRRSYAFYGRLRSELAPALQQEEDRLIREHALNGEYVGAAWRRRA